MKSLEKKLWNRLDWGLRALDVSTPNDLTGVELLQWARNKLRELAEESVEDGDRIAAARALVSSAHAEIEFADKVAARKSEAASPITSLPVEGQRAALIEARRRLDAYEAQLNAKDAPAGLLGGPNPQEDE